MAPALLTNRQEVMRRLLPTVDANKCRGVAGRHARHDLAPNAKDGAVGQPMVQPQQLFDFLACL